MSGLSFVEVADTPSPAGQADIRVGWDNFGNPPAGEIGNAFSSVVTATKKFAPGTIMRLQDPAITPLAASGGTLLYQNTASSAYQVMLHEIGHALGLDHAVAGTDPAAVMGPAAGAANRDLDISDIAGIRAVYGAIAAPVATSIAIDTLLATRPDGTTGHTFTVTRTGNIAAAHSAAWSVTGTGASPASAADFAGGILADGTFDFLPGQTSQPITVLVAGDTLVEPNEDFQVLFANPTGGAALGVASATRSILGDDATLSIAAASANKPEGTGGSTGFSFTVTRAGGTAIAHSAGWSVAGIAGSGTAPALGADFAGGVFPAGIFNFAAGEVSRTITLAVAAETLAEVNERFAVTLTGPSVGAALGTALAQGIILDDDTIFSTAADEDLVGSADADVFYLGDGVADLTILLDAEAPVDASWFVL